MRVKHYVLLVMIACLAMPWLVRAQSVELHRGTVIARGSNYCGTINQQNQYFYTGQIARVSFNGHPFMPWADGTFFGNTYYDNGNTYAWTSSAMDFGYGSSAGSLPGCQGTTPITLRSLSLGYKNESNGGSHTRWHNFTTTFTEQGILKHQHVYLNNVGCSGSNSPQFGTNWLRHIYNTWITNETTLQHGGYSVLNLDLQVHSRNLPNTEHSYFKFFRWKFPENATLVPTSENAAHPGEPVKVVRFKKNVADQEYIVVALVKKNPLDRGYFGLMADNGTTTPGYSSNTYELFYSWSPISPTASRRREDAAFTPVGNEFHLNAPLEVRMFTAPTDAAGYQAKVNAVLADVYSAYAAAYPMTNDFQLRAPIGIAYLSSYQSRTASNPRGWSLDGQSIDVGPAGIESFRTRLLSHIRTSCQRVRNLGGQGLMIWALEGHEDMHSTQTIGVSYVGDPRSVHALAPELTHVSTQGNLLGQGELQDEVFKIIRDEYSLIPGLLIRPQILSWPGRRGPNEGNCPRQIPINLRTHASRVAGNAVIDTLMANKIYYAYKRFGARLFYVDSPFGYDPGSYLPIPVDGEVYHSVRERVKALCLQDGIPYEPIMISPEKVTGLDQYRSATPFWKYADGGTVGAVQGPDFIAEQIYPAASLFIDLAVDGAPGTTQLPGDIAAKLLPELLACRHISGFRAWYSSPEYGIMETHMYNASLDNQIPNVPCTIRYSPTTYVKIQDVTSTTFTANNGQLCGRTILTDPQGVDQDYLPGQWIIRTLTPPAGKRIQADLVSYNIGTGDGLTFWNSDQYPQGGIIGSAGNTSATERIVSTHSTGATTARFNSDATNQGRGFQYRISCPPACRAVWLGHYPSSGPEGTVVRIRGVDFRSGTGLLSCDPLNDPIRRTRVFFGNQEATHVDYSQAAQGVILARVPAGAPNMSNIVLYDDVNAPPTALANSTPSSRSVGMFTVTNVVLHNVMNDNVFRGSVHTCSATFTDPQGPSADYVANHYSIHNLYPATPGGKVTMTLTDLDLGATHYGQTQQVISDQLSIYDGEFTASPPTRIGHFTSANNFTAPTAFTFTATNAAGVLSTRWYSNAQTSDPANSITRTFGRGFQAAITCQAGLRQGADGPASVSRLSVYPNPSSGQVSLDYHGSTDQEYTVVDCLGRRIASGVLSAGSSTQTIRIRETGIYLLRYGARRSVRIVIE